MGIFKVIKAAAAGAAEVVAEPEPKKMSLIDEIMWRMTDVPRDGTSLLFCMAMSLSICFAVVLAQQMFLKERSVEQEVSIEHEESVEQEVSIEQEESVEQEVSVEQEESLEQEESVEQEVSVEQEESVEQGGSVEQEESEQKETVGKIVNATAEEGDTEDDTVSKDDSQPFDDPPTPTMPPPTKTIVVVNESPAPSIPDMSPSRISSRRVGLLTAKAKSIGGSIRRLGKNEYTSKLK